MGIEQHWCPKCEASTDHMMVKGLWKCNSCLAKKLNARKQAGSMVPKPAGKLESKVTMVCPCCGVGIKIALETIV